MSSTRDLIDERLRSLPDPLLPEVLAFLTQLESRSRYLSEPTSADSDQPDPLLSLAGALTGEPISSQQIDQELYGDEFP